MVDAGFQNGNLGGKLTNKSYDVSYAPNKYLFVCVSAVRVCVLIKNLQGRQTIKWVRKCEHAHRIPPTFAIVTHMATISFVV